MEKSTKVIPSRDRPRCSGIVLDSQALVPFEGEVSVIIPLFNEAKNIPILLERVAQVLRPLIPFEIVCVNDGSTDESLETLISLSPQYPELLIVDLSRNFGQQSAITAGIELSSGKAVIVADADLQDPPESFPLLIEKWKEGFNVVYAIREARPEHWLKRFCYSLFYRVLCKTADIAVPPDAGDFGLLDSHAVNLLRLLPEKNRFIRGLRSWIGLKQCGVPINRGERHGGTPAYSFPKLVNLALDGLFSFSFVPLRLISLLGLSVSLLSVCLALFYGLKKLLVGLNPPGFATIVVMLSFLSGIQLLTMGVLGEYLGRVFLEVKQRPVYVVRKIYQNKVHDEDSHPE